MVKLRRKRGLRLYLWHDHFCVDKLPIIYSCLLHVAVNSCRSSMFWQHRFEMMPRCWQHWSASEWCWLTSCSFDKGVDQKTSSCQSEKLNKPTKSSITVKVIGRAFMEALSHCVQILIVMRCQQFRCLHNTGHSHRGGGVLIVKHWPATLIYMPVRPEYVLRTWTLSASVTWPWVVCIELMCQEVVQGP